jgi:hypothetical protein
VAQLLIGAALEFGLTASRYHAEREVELVGPQQELDCARPVAAVLERHGGASLQGTERGLAPILNETLTEEVAQQVVVAVRSGTLGVEGEDVVACQVVQLPRSVR